MHDYLKPQQRGTKTREWAYRVLLASLLLVLAACQAAPRLTEVSLPTSTTSPIPVPTIAVTPTFIAVPTPTPETAAPCSMDVLAYVFAAELRLPAGSPELGRQVDSQEAYQSAFGVSPDLPYDPQQPLTGINWNIQRQLAALGIELAENGRAVVLPKFAQGVGIEEIIRRDAPEAQIFFAGVNEGQAPATALRAVIHASENGGYVVNLTDGAGNFYLLVEEGTGRTIGWPGDVGVERATDVVRLANPAGGEVVPLKVNGCDWLLGVVGEDGRVVAALAMVPGMDVADLAWQMNPNPPEAVVMPEPTATLAGDILRNACVQSGDLPNACDLLTPEMTAELDAAQIPRFLTRGPDGNLTTLPDGMVDSLAVEFDLYGSDGAVVETIEQTGVACTVRGLIPYPIDGHDTIHLLYCQAMMPSGQTQGLFFKISSSSEGIDNVHITENNQVPGSYEALMDGTRMVSPEAVYRMLASGVLDGRQIVVLVNRHSALPDEVSDEYAQLWDSMSAGQAFTIPDNDTWGIITQNWILPPECAEYFK